MTMRFTRSTSTILAAALALLCTAGDSLALTAAELKCRDGAARIARGAMARAFKVRINCVRQHVVGSYDPTIDCSADPEELGGTGTGDLGADRRLAKLALSRVRAGDVLESRCRSTNPEKDVLPSDVLLDDICSPASDEWADVGPCLVDRGMQAALLMLEGLELPGPGPIGLAATACMDSVLSQSRRTLGTMSRYRSLCFHEDDERVPGTFECGATIMPFGTVQTTLLERADTNLVRTFPRVDEALRLDCDIPLEDVGFDLITPDVTGGRFASRITLDDVGAHLNDLFQETTHLVVFGDTGSEGLFDATQAEGFCGDGTQDPDEQCDDGNNYSCDGCDRDCTVPACGNGAVCAPEECDDGNAFSGDGCSAACVSELCGNSVVNPGYDEDCDTGGESAGCDDDCSLATCGDQYVNAAAGETCDEGTGLPLELAQDTPTCDGDCSAPGCPDGYWNPQNVTAPAPGSGEECDDGGFSMGCDTNCTLASCGDGDVNPVRGEQCDDSNFSDSDDCPSSSTVPGSDCQDAFCGDGFQCTGGGCSSPEACDDGDGTLGSSESATCDDDCTTAVCGDSNVNPTAGEQCDQGGANANTRLCTLGCQDAFCGDGLTCSHGTCNTGPGGAPEQCDDADGNNQDPCLNNCAVATCGDSVLCSDVTCTTGPGSTPEQCDDGGVNTASCDANCTAAFCQDGTFNAAAGEQCDGGMETPTCDVDCTLVSCGDSTINTTAGEQCDDGTNGNTLPCTGTCQDAFCGDGLTCSHPTCTSGPSGNPEQCDGAGETVGCDTDCSTATCGDSQINVTAGETCDDGGESATCDADCSAVSCGDSTINTTAGEQCDDGTNGNTLPCTGTCQTATCGDGLTCSDPSCTSGGGGPEACDQGGLNGSGSGFCNATCTGIDP
ncbi:MAG: DUF4215 domain-containing protein [Candidatus Binatia bacterium]